MGRVIAVGDPNQAIYGFRGADSNSFNMIKECLNAKELPLSYCYRCERKIIRKAQEIVPRIECPEGTGEGHVESISHAEALDLAEAGDFFLCRVKVPLIETCLELISYGKKAFVAGEDRSREMCEFTEKLIDQAGGLDTIAIQEAAQKAHEKMMRERKFFQAEAYLEKVEMICAILSSPLVENSRSFISLIKDIFTPSSESIRLSTVHKVKGLESNRVFILHPELIPHPRAKSQEQIQQEMNLKYVAVTRARKELYYVSS